MNITTQTDATEAQVKSHVAELLIRAVAVLNKQSSEQATSSRLASLLNLALACAAEESEGARSAIKTHGPEGFDLNVQQGLLAKAAGRVALSCTEESPQREDVAQKLAQAIRAAGIKAGICHPDAALTGTHLLMLLDDMANHVASTQNVQSGNLH